MTEIKYKTMLNSRSVKSTASLGVCFLALIVAGCSSSKSPNFYSLSPQVSTNLSSQQKVRMIEVLPVGLSDRLNRIPLVLQSEGGQSSVLFDDRWTSTLSAELRDSLSARLQQKLGAVDRYNSGMTGGQAAYRIAVDFSNFDFVERSDKQLQVLMNATWTARYDDPKRPLSSPQNAQTMPRNQQISCRMSLSQTVQPQSKKLVGLVNTSQTVLDQLSQSIALSITQLESQNKQPISGVSCS